MEVYNKVYADALVGNEQETNRWIAYREELRQVKENLSFYRTQLKVDILIPIGSKAFVPGQLYHTGEVMASHGCGYFSDCSVDQATRIIDHRISNADRMILQFEREKELFSSKLEVPFAEDAFGGQEIVEEYDEEREKMWREQHRKRVKEYKQQEVRSELESDEGVFSRLEELELMEELEQEMERLDVAVENDEQLRQLMSGEVRVNEKKRLAHNSEGAMVAVTDVVAKDGESFEVETTDDETGSDNSEDSYNDISPEFAILLQNTKSMNTEQKVAAFRQKLSEINDSLRRNSLTIEEKVNFCDLRYEIEEALDFLCPAWESTAKPSKKKRTIKFADTDSVKIIENQETEPSASPSASAARLTLELNVSHSAAAQSPNSRSSGEGKEIVSPADIYRLFEHCMQRDDCGTAAEQPKTKSILKNRDKVLEERHREEAPALVKTSRAKEPIRVDIIGDVIEHSAGEIRAAEPSTSGRQTAVATGKKKISRFKQQRS